MTTRQIIFEQLTAYLNHQLTLTELVDWAETRLIDPNIPENEDTDLLMDVLMYLGAADSQGFPLTWDVLSSFIERLGGNIHVVVETA